MNDQLSVFSTIPIRDSTVPRSSNKDAPYLSEATGDDGLAQLGDGEGDMSGNELMSDGEEEFQTLPDDESAGEEEEGGMGDDMMEGSADEGGTCAGFNQAIIMFNYINHQNNYFFIHYNSVKLFSRSACPKKCQRKLKTPNCRENFRDFFHSSWIL